MTLKPPPGSAPSHVTDHPFTPPGEGLGKWFDLCDKCHLAESAHADTLLTRNETGKVVGRKDEGD